MTRPGTGEQGFGGSLDRREFLVQAGRWSAGAGLLCSLLPAWAQSPDAPGREVDFYERLPEGRIRCGVCPRHCVVPEGNRSYCRTKVNVGGTWYTRAYNNPCILQVDPIEKMPLNHFRPGSSTLTVAIGGCNLRCLYCQNWQQSQQRPEQVERFEITPQGIVAAAREKGIDTIAFNYTDFVASLEFATDLARAARQAELRVVAATGAYVEPEPLLGFARHADALIIGLKGYNEDFYRSVVSGGLEAVLRAITTIARETDCWLELINLIVPTYNDDPDEIRRLCGWVRREVGVMTPLHFARFVPMYRMRNLPRTPVPTLEQACRTARQVGLKHVYTSNLAPHPGTSTYCHKCGTSLIQRLGFRILENSLQQDRCPKCHARLPGVWQ